MDGQPAKNSVMGASVRGSPVSGRNWKDLKTPTRHMSESVSLKKHSEWEAKSKREDQRRNIVKYENELKEKKKELKEKLKANRKAREKRRLENKKKNEVVVRIKDIRKVKKMNKKQRADIEMR